MKNLSELLKQFNLEKPEDTIIKFEHFYNALTEANKTVNLTAVTGKEEIEQKHFIDSLAAYPHIKAGSEVLDIGAGAGFPSIPLAICLRSVHFTLVDSVGKKVSFLESIKEVLKLENVSVIKSRAEEMNKNKKYDYVLARGVAELNTLCEYCLPFVKVNGIIIAYKAQRAEEEIMNAEAALRILSGKIEQKIPYQLCLNDEIFRRTLILIRKTKETDNKYPRSGNKPRLMPL